ncbi:MAG: hypothetical protein LUH22_10940 [Bacteroides sp.]|nr:hypothetical protein [Bacteroides sp.]
MMKRNLYAFIFLLFNIYSFAQNPKDYTPLDKSNPISFRGSHIIYQGEKINLSDKSFFIDGQLSDSEVANQPFVFNSINNALKHITDGSEAEPMTLYLAPYVYWVDDPDDPEIRRPIEGAIPYGEIVKCNWLKFFGLTDDPENVVLASWRGQTQGAVGNFTMFYFDGDGISSENVTFGNYCNVDLDYPLLPQLSRPRRSSAITQAQLIICNSDKVVARNTHFISRLNLCPFAGAKRIIFDQCYFESTDDALCSTGVYLNSRFTFYGSKPFFKTDGTGAVFLNCDFDVVTRNRQYLTKVPGPVTIVDSRFKNSSGPLFVGWTQDPTDDLRCYQYNVSLNGTPLLIGNDKPEVTVDMTNKPLLDAYRIEHQGQVIYNTYNLLRGNDDWDPMGVKDQILQCEKQIGRNLTNIPTYLKILPSVTSIESGVTHAKLTATIQRFGNYEYCKEPVIWSVLPDVVQLVELEKETNNICIINGINNDDESKKAIIHATTTIGIESASALTVSPRFIEPPRFTSLPKIINKEKGKLRVDYKIDLEGRKDESLITWYHCTDGKGSKPIEIIVSRSNNPKYEYELSDADVGYYIKASVSPKHLRSHPGKAVAAITSAPVAQKNIFSKRSYYTDFKNFPVSRQPQIIPGFWTIDGYKPLGLEEYDWKAPTGETWYYGVGSDGMKDTGLVQTTKGARLLYTPVKGDYGDMSVTLNVDPGKQAGQGFGSATGQFMDIYIKFDTQTLTGYGLRIIRTTKYHNAVDFILMKYERGVATPISKPVSSVCYRTDCTIKLKAEGNKLTAHAETKTGLPESMESDLKKSVDLQAEIRQNKYGGIGIQHTGSTGANATMLHWLQIDW